MARNRKTKKQSPRVGSQYQATIPEISHQKEDIEFHSDNSVLLWKPTDKFSDDQLNEYVTFAKKWFHCDEDRLLSILLNNNVNLLAAQYGLDKYNPKADELMVHKMVNFGANVPPPTSGSLTHPKTTAIRQNFIGCVEEGKEDDENQNGSANYSRKEDDEGENAQPVSPPPLNYDEEQGDLFTDYGSTEEVDEERATRDGFSREESTPSPPPLLMPSDNTSDGDDEENATGCVSSRSPSRTPSPPPLLKIKPNKKRKRHTLSSHHDYQRHSRKKTNPHGSHKRRTKKQRTSSSTTTTRRRSPSSSASTSYDSSSVSSVSPVSLVWSVSSPSSASCEPSSSEQSSPKKPLRKTKKVIWPQRSGKSSRFCPVSRPDARQVAPRSTRYSRAVLSAPDAVPRPGLPACASVDRPYNCDICGKNYTRNGYLFRHRVDVHKVDMHGYPIDPEKQWTCNKCNPSREFWTKLYLEHHDKTFHSNPKF